MAGIAALFVVAVCVLAMIPLAIAVVCFLAQALMWVIGVGLAIGLAWLILVGICALFTSKSETKSK